MAVLNIRAGAPVVLVTPLGPVRLLSRGQSAPSCRCANLQSAFYRGDPQQKRSACHDGRCHSGTKLSSCFVRICVTKYKLCELIVVDLLNSGSAWTSLCKDTVAQKSKPLYQWSFRKTGTMATLASQAEIGVWVQAQHGGECTIPPRYDSRKKIYRLYIRKIL